MELDDIKSLLGFPVYQRARMYFEQGHVEKINIHPDEKISALVRGSNSKSYMVFIHLAEEKFNCSCPYPYHCKHIGAVLLALHHQNRSLLKKYSKYVPDNYDAMLKEITAQASTASDIIIPLHQDLQLSQFSRDDSLMRRNASVSIEISGKQARRYRLVFLIEDHGPIHECSLLPAVQYIKRNGMDGRIENYSPEKITEPVSPASERLLKNLLADKTTYFQMHDMLITYLPFIVEHDDIALMYRNMYEPALVHKEKIEKLVISFEIYRLIGKSPSFIPLFSINGKKPFFRNEISMNATGNSAYIFNITGSLYYSFEDPDIAFIIKHFRHDTREFSLNDITYLCNTCREMNNAALSVEFTKKEVRITNLIPVPVVTLEPGTFSLGLTLSFSYLDNEIPYGNREQYLKVPSEKNDEYLVAKRNFAFEDMFYKKFISLVGKSPGFSLFDLHAFGELSPGPSISIGMTLAQFFAALGKKLSDAGVEFKMKNMPSRFSMSMGRMFLSIRSGIAWFEVDAKYREEGKEYDIRIDLQYLKDGLVQVGDSYRILSTEEIELLSQLAEHGMKDGKSAKVHKKDLATVNTIIELTKEENIEGDVDEAAQVNEIFKRLQNFSSLNEYPLPEKFQGTLRPYQTTGYHWLRFLNEYAIGGCLADDMGLGKTIQTLALLQSLKENKKLSTSLIVVPVTTMPNWMNEIERFTPSLSVLPHRGPHRDRDGSSFYRFDIVLTSYQTLQRDIKMFSSRMFHYIVLDEAQYIKNANSKTFDSVLKLSAEHKLSLSGTPIENNTFELWAQMEFLNPGILGKKEYFRDYYTKPIEKYQDEEAVKKLRKKIYPFILRRKKEDVAHDLPPKEVITVYIDMTEKQRELYETWRKHFNNEIEEALQTHTPEQATMTILTALLRLRQICIFPELFNREYITVGSGKFDHLKDMIDEMLFEDHKVICFSQFVKALSIMRKHFDEKHIRYSYIDGQTKNREDQIETFQKSNSTPLFLISLKAGGLGINLTAADYVIIFDPWWNPAVENQAIDRAHRIGRKNKVIAYRLIMKNSIEEKIEQLQNKKRKLASDLITDETSLLKKLSKDDIMELFR